MTKEQAYNNFLSGFGMKAYDVDTVPDDAELPYITYDFSVSDFDNPVLLSASVWDRSTSWNSVTAIADIFFRAIGYGGKIIPFDGGAMWVKRGQPFAQRMADEDDSIRRIFFNVEVEFLIT